MRRVKLSDAKLHFSELLEEVASGTTIMITRRCLPAAMLVPIGITSRKLPHRELVEAMGELRKRVKPDKMTVVEMVKGGRSARNRIRR